MAEVAPARHGAACACARSAPRDAAQTRTTTTRIRVRASKQGQQFVAFAVGAEQPNKQPQTRKQERKKARKQACTASNGRERERRTYLVVGHHPSDASVAEEVRHILDVAVEELGGMRVRQLH